MKIILTTVITATLAVVCVESLKCVQCNSVTDSCSNINSTECPIDASVSCTSSLMTFFQNNNSSSYKNMACSAKNCTEWVDVTNDFTVRVSENEHFYFASQCCQGKECNDTSNGPPSQNVSTNLQCAACYGLNETLCNKKPLTCYNDERCVELVTEFENETQVVKGCSNVSNFTCQSLSAGNQILEGFTFLKFKCEDASPVPTSPSVNITSNSTSSTNTTSINPTTSTSSKVAFVPVTLSSLLLLGLLL